MPNYIKGLDRIVRNFDKLTLRDINTNAALAGAEVIREQASQNAPRGETGNLSRLEITKVAVKKQDRVVVKIGPSTTAFYGMFIELGTVHMAPEPFLGPALEQKMSEAIQETTAVIQFALAAQPE
jgi:HK97 gp10 family phage protein